MEGKHPIEGIVYTAMHGLREMIDVNTIVGDPVSTPDGSVIIPISKVSLGFGVGGSEFERDKKLGSSAENPKQNMFGGAAGGGMSLTPEAFLVVGGGTIRLIPVNPQNSLVDRVIDMAPVAIDKICELFRKKDGGETPGAEPDEEIDPADYINVTKDPNAEE